MSRTTYLIAFALVLVLGATGRPGPLLAAVVVLVLLTTAHLLASSHPTNPTH